MMEIETRTQKVEPGNLVAKSAGMGCLTGLILSVVFLVIAWSDLSSEADIVIGFLLVIISLIICPLQGLLISWLVIQFGSQSRAMAIVIGALVTLIMMAVGILFLGPLGLGSETFILVLVFSAIGIWVADRTFRRISVDRSFFGILPRAFYVSLVGLIIVALFIVVYIYAWHAIVSLLWNQL